MRGENCVHSQFFQGFSGSSPHARGKLVETEQEEAEVGLIPACAGKTHSGKVADLIDEAHPRMRGENHQVAYGVRRVFGSSPHARGKLKFIHKEVADTGLIPACAGKTPRTLCTLCNPTAHPRMRGENAVCGRNLPCGVGSSPHARGKHPGSQRALPAVGLIPACAGKTWKKYYTGDAATAHPRMRGENNDTSRAEMQGRGSSPHARGKLARARRAAFCAGLIPACAGKTACYAR